MTSFGNQQSLERAQTAFSRAVAVVVAAVGLTVLTAWIFDIPRIINISPSLATLKVNTSIAFTLLGVALWLVNARPGNILFGLRVPRAETLACITRICAVLVGLIGLITLGEYIFGRDAGIDNFLVQDHRTLHAAHPGRMARLTALDFTLLGLAFLSIDLETPRGKRPAQWFAILVFLEGFIAFLGYIYGAQTLYYGGAYATTALQTAIATVLISIGFLFARPGKGLMLLSTDTTAGGWIFRHFLPAAVLIVPVLGWFRLRGQHAGLYGTEFGVALMVSSNVVCLSVLIWWAAGFVRAEILSRTELEEKMETNQERANEQAAMLEQRVHERTLKLEEAVEELERSTYTISHNLRAPVRSVLAFADFVIADCGYRLDAADRDHLNRIKASAQRMDRLIEGVLEYARVSRTDTNLAPVELDHLVDELLPDYAHGADVRIVHPLGVVRANEALLEQAVSNLLDNAAKFARPGTTPQIEVWTELWNGNLRLIVHDHGVGVPAESGDKIFRTFERAHEGYAGTGIGLAIVKRAVERMDGQVGFDSEAGEGSSFWLELPKARDGVGFA